MIERLADAELYFNIVNPHDDRYTAQEAAKRIVALLLADDLSLFARTLKKAQTILDVLSKFCKETRCQFNIEKKKSVILRIF